MIPYLLSLCDKVNSVTDIAAIAERERNLESLMAKIHKQLYINAVV